MGMVLCNQEETEVVVLDWDRMGERVEVGCKGVVGTAVHPWVLFPVRSIKILLVKERNYTQENDLIYTAFLHV